MAFFRLFFTAAAVAFVSQCQVAAVSAAVAGVSGATLFARACVQCDDSTPACNCKSDETCSLVSQTCDACAFVQCTKNNSGGGSSPPIGAIVGGAIGGIVVVALIMFLWWRKHGKQQRERASMAATAAEKENDFGMLKSQRASTHTVASIASTVRTRASNVIQIAYIPGVTNRSAPASPSHLVPPVPPIPAMGGSPVGSQFPRTPTGDIQFDVHDLLRRSVATVDRSSVATTIYGQNAVVSQPNIVRAGKANVVQVKNGSSTATSSTGSPSLENAPPIPPLFAAKTGLQPGDGKPPRLDAVPPSPAFSIGSTFFNRMHSTKSNDTDTARGHVIGGQSERNENHSTSSFIVEDDSDDELTPEDRRKKAQSQCSSCITDMDSPFSDANSMDIDALPAPAGAGLPPGTQARKPAAAGKRSSQRIRSLVGGDERTVSPFDDSHSIDKAGS